jgi:hypothetical protein
MADDDLLAGFMDEISAIPEPTSAICDATAAAAADGAVSAPAKAAAPVPAPPKAPAVSAAVSAAVAAKKKTGGFAFAKPVAISSVIAKAPSHMTAKLASAVTDEQRLLEAAQKAHKARAASASAPAGALAGTAAVPAALSGYYGGAAAATAAAGAAARGGAGQQAQAQAVRQGSGWDTTEQAQYLQQQAAYDYDRNKFVHQRSDVAAVSAGIGPQGAPPASSSSSTAQQQQQQQQQQPDSRKRHIRAGAGALWEDKTLDEWPENDHRIFVGDLGNEVSEALLMQAFRHYRSCQKTKVVRDGKTGKSKGFGFVSFADPYDMAKALREMNGKYIGNRPIKLRKSNWEQRGIDQVRKKARTQKKARKLLGGD